MIVDRPRRNLLALCMGALAALALSVLGFIGYLGYFGGPIYRLDPPTGPVHRSLRGTTVVFLSGDTGFNAAMAPVVMRDLASNGLPVLGINSLTAFRNGRTPDQTVALIEDAIGRAMRLPGARRVVLVGQSFGSDVLQYGLSRLSPALKPDVRQVLLSVPGDTIMFQTHPGGLFYGKPDRAAVPSARRIDWTPVTCVYGAEERDSLCPFLHARNVRAIALPGGHYLHHDADLLAATLWQAIVLGH